VEIGQRLSENWIVNQKTARWLRLVRWACLYAPHQPLQFSSVQFSSKGDTTHSINRQTSNSVGILRLFITNSCISLLTDSNRLDVWFPSHRSMAWMTAASGRLALIFLNIEIKWRSSAVTLFWQSTQCGLENRKVDLRANLTSWTTTYIACTIRGLSFTGKKSSLAITTVIHDGVSGFANWLSPFVQ